MAEEVASIGIKMETGDVSRGIQTLDQLISIGGRVERSMDGIGGAASGLGRRMRDLWSSFTRTGDAAKTGAAGVRDLGQSLENLQSTADLATRGIQAFIGLKVVSWAKDGAAALFEASAAAERLRTSLDFASARGSAGELVYLRKTTDELGLSFKGTAQAYQQFQAASRGTALEGQKARDVFEAISKASAVMGLSAEQSSGALLALQQMVSKGTVQAEELRGQLGERLPGAFQTAARAMGVTTAELGKMLEQGQVIATDFLPKFAAELERSLGNAAEKAADRLDASANRMGNAWDRLKQRVGDSGISQQMAQEMNFLTRAMDAITDKMDSTKAAGGGLWEQLGSGAGTAAARVAFGVVESSASGLNYVINKLTGNILDLETNVSILPDRFKSNSEQVQILAGKVKEADEQLAHLQSLGGQFGSERWYQAEIKRAQSVAKEYRDALAAKNAMVGGAAGGPNPADANFNYPMRGQSYRAYAEAQAESEKELQQIRMREQGINSQYFKDIASLQRAKSVGTLTEDAYIREMASLATRTYESSTTGRDAKKKTREGGKAAGTAERLDAAMTSADIARVKSFYDEMASIYSGSEAIMEQARKSGLISEREYYDAKISFVELNIDAKKRELAEENKLLEMQNATGVKDIERDKKIQTNKDRMARLDQESIMKTTLLTMEADAAIRGQAESLESSRRSAEDYLATLQIGIDREVAGVGMGGNERNIEAGRQQIEDRYQQQRMDLANQRAKAEADANGSLNAAQRQFYEDRLAIINEYEGKATEAYLSGVSRRMAAESDWSKGAARAFKDYAYTAENVAQLTNDAFSNGLKGMEDALVTFVTTGKLSFSDMANSIVADITRIIIKQQISNALGIAGSGGGSGGGGLMGIIGAGLSLLGGSSAVATVANAMPGDSLDNFLDLKGLSGGRARGGGVSARGVYGIAEEGPEILTVKNRNYLVMGGDSGSVTPNHQLGDGGGGSKIYMTLPQPPQGMTRATMLQYGRTVGQQIQIAMGRNG